MNERRRQNRRRAARMASIEQMIERRRQMRTIIMGFLFTVALGILLYRIWYFHAVWGEEYSMLVAQQGARHQMGLFEQNTAPSRGIITDRNMQPIASTRQVFSVSLDPMALHHRHNRDSRDYRNIKEDLFMEINRAFGTHRLDFQGWFNYDFDGNVLTTSRYRVLARDVSPEIAIPLAEMFPEIHARETSLRWHHDPFFAPQVLGFRWGDSLWGLESRFDRDLRGDPGRTVWIQGGEVEEVPVRDGYTLVTTFDADIQRMAQRHADMAFFDLIAEGRPADFVGIIVMNPHTGEILAMAQAPNFSLAEPMNPNYFTCLTTVEMWGEPDFNQTDAVMRLWRNFHTTRSAEPGSTFKPFVIAAALEEGLINWNQPFYCEGRRLIHDQYIHCWNQWGHGQLTVSEALYRSCNLVMVDINNRLRNTTFYRYRGYFGFGGYTGIDIPGEWDVSSAQVMYPLWRLNMVEMATSSMGQGFNSTTIQMINGYAALINGGEIMQPFFVSQIVDSSGNVVRETEPTVVRRAISRETSDMMRREMQLVVTAEHGTGRQLAIPGHTIGGKTGTAQQGIRANDMASLTYVAFTPVDNPEFLVLMTIDYIYAPRGSGVNAGNYVAPRLRAFFEELFRTRNVLPTEGNMALDDWHIAMGATVMDNFAGRRLHEVTPTLNRFDSGGFQVVGSGTIISHHFPEAGAPMPETVPIIFHMLPETRIDILMTVMPEVEGLPVSQAQFLLTEMGLPHVTFISTRPANVGDGNFSPHTAGAEPASEYSDDPIELPEVVYRQFPAPGTELEIGTQVMIRAR